LKRYRNVLEGKKKNEMKEIIYFCVIEKKLPIISSYHLDH
jgi:hypothetical protein